jgi:hypothetical protein
VEPEVLRALASLKSLGKSGGSDFSARPRQRACQDPLTRKGDDALREKNVTTRSEI